MTAGMIVGEINAHPLRWGETLATHEWVELHIHKLLASRFVAVALAEGRRGDIATALFLWSESFRQDPAGTLPDDDVQLARLAMFGTDVDGWRAVRPHVLWGWHPVIVDGEATDAIPRLGHRLIGDIAARMFRRKSSRDQGRKAQNQAVRRSRLRKKLESMGYKRLAVQEAPVNALLDWLDAASLYLSDDNIRAGLEAIGAARLVALRGPSEG